MPIKTRQAAPPKLTESEIQSRIIARLRADDWCVVRLNSGGFKNHATGSYLRAYIVQGLNASSGLPDVVAFRGDEYLLIECKDAKGKLSDSQKRFHEFAARFGIKVHVLRHWDELEAITQ